jgi:hypothetical protein
MRFSKKIFLSLLIIFLLIFSFLSLNLKKPKEIKAASTDNVWGWAWAGGGEINGTPTGTVGWISFNCTNTDCCATSSYGVNINSDGTFSGYAWSENIGWISFSPPAPYPTCPAPTCPFPPNYSACLDLPGPGQVCDGAGDYKVTGWAQAISPIGNPNAGGWDGWILLGPIFQNGTDYGVWLDTSSGPPYEFKGWAWGSDVVGWISFNCSNQGVCGTSNYKVLTSFSINNPPYVEPGSPTTTNEEYCDNSPTGLISIQWKYMDNDGDPQAEYNLQVATDPAFNPADIILDYTASSPVPAGGLGTSAIRVVPAPVTPGQPEIPYTGSLATRYWQVRVRAQSGDPNWSNWGDVVSFVIPPHPPPQCDFIWVPLHPSVGEIVQFYDQSIAYGGATTTSWSWNFQHGNPPSSTIQNPTTTFTAIESAGNEISLQVCDDTPPAMGGPYCCTQTKKLTVTLPLPKWKEIKP